MSAHVWSWDVTSYPSSAAVPGSVAISLVLQNFVKPPHVEPATTSGALDEMLALVLRFTAEPLADDWLGQRHNYAFAYS
jgi:hypothetical protein